jgi:dienelactone hydrolase
MKLPIPPSVAFVIAFLLCSSMLVPTLAVWGKAPPPSPAGGKRYQDEIFASYQVQSEVQYGLASGVKLYLDLYTGTGDTATSRPGVVFIHGGGFKMGDKNLRFPVSVCGNLARRGYVAASINYRLTSTLPNDTVYFEAMLRALQDAKAAVRFLRKSGTLYGVDTSQIFVSGSSAGAITALHLAYLDSAHVPGYVNWNNVGGTFEGTSGNPGFSSEVQAVIANWGAIGDTAWITRRDLPVYCVHGTSDSTVYYNLIPAYGPFLYSSKYIIADARQKDITNGLRLFINAGHELNNDTTKQDSAVSDFCAWLSTIVKSTATSVRESPSTVPASISLFQNYPNPFNPSTEIAYVLPSSMRVLLDVYNTLGQRIATLVDQTENPGVHKVTFDAAHRASGVYFYRLRTPEATLTGKMLLSK